MKTKFLIETPTLFSGPQPSLKGQSGISRVGKSNHKEEEEEGWGFNQRNEEENPPLPLPPLRGDIGHHPHMTDYTTWNKCSEGGGGGVCGVGGS